MNVTFAGNEYPLVGKQIQEGAFLPAFSLMTPELKRFSPEDVRFPVIFLTFPSVDNGPCSHDMLAFHDRLKNTGWNVCIVTVDLPFALDRWVKENSVTALAMLSDYRDLSFGRATGTLVDHLMFLARTALIFDKAGQCVYSKIGPDYDEVTEQARRYFD